jgi:4-alpha-glucanotransferase
LKILPQREAGACLHLTSLPGAHGVGSLGKEALRFIDALADAGLRVWQFLPTGPTGYGDSPYQSASAFAGNPLLIDLVELREQALLTDAELAGVAELPRSKVDYQRLIPFKTQLLARAGERFARKADVDRRLARDEFIAQHDRVWLHDYALFEVLKGMHQQRAWTEWEPVYARRDPDALRTLEQAAQVQIECVKSIQFLFFEQWQALRRHAAYRGLRLMGDIPIYLALDSADAWSNRELLNLAADGTPEEVAGVPPDYFSADGQRWGNPLYRWDRHAADGYQWWIARFAHAIALADLVRVDHFRGFEAYWAVPAESKTARVGEWRPGPGVSLFDALQTALGQLPVIAEDLGVITPAVDALRARYGFPGMQVLQFLVGEDDFDIAAIPENCVCYTGTHDNDTTVGWFNGGRSDIRTPDQIRRMQENVLRRTQGTAETINKDMLELALSTRAALVIAPIQDFLGLGSSARLNRPGTTTKNWRWRLSRKQLTDEFCASIRTMVEDAHRL